VVQFSRGCRRKCSHCGQWDFWKSWPRRSIESFVGDVDHRARHGVRLFWIADENWGIDQRLFLRLLAELKAVNRGQYLIVAMEVAHVFAREIAKLVRQTISAAGEKYCALQRPVQRRRAQLNLLQT
jgi:radical SAM superfamily enzyme YgiQ (UPF0313 family)